MNSRPPKSLPLPQTQETVGPRVYIVTVPTPIIAARQICRRDQRQPIIEGCAAPSLSSDSFPAAEEICVPVVRVGHD
jgi:hypothetical protein